uniref:Uncharacterized protein n=1 Tax=Amphimedon queenslandica TaxID=400682 RepID=A0A1X7TUH0_AMPQE
GRVGTIANRNNSAWHGLNDVVADWLRGNTTVYDDKGSDKGVKANTRWLYDAVRAIDKDLGTKIAEKYGIEEQIISTSAPSDTGATGGNEGIEEPDS